jgi:hypothetical protein
MMRTRYLAGRRLFESLLQVRRLHNGDLEEYLILYALVLTATYDRLERPDVVGVGCEAKGLNLLSISEITGVPRETARRKIYRLMQAGSVLKCDDGLYHYIGDGEDDIIDKIFKDLPNFRAA